MRVGTADFLCPLIHQRNKIFDRAGNIFPCGIGSFIGGSNHDSVETFLQRNGFSLVHTHIGTVCRYAEYRFVAEFHDIVQIALFHREKCGHNFRCAGGIETLVDIFRIENNACICVHQDGSLCAYLWACRPVINFI